MQESIRIAQEQGIGTQLVFTHFRYAEILHKKGDLDAARDQLEQAEELRERIDRGEPSRGLAPYVDGPPE